MIYLKTTNLLYKHVDSNNEIDGYQKEEKIQWASLLSV